MQLQPEARVYVAAAETKARSRPSREPVDLVGARLLPGTAALLGVDIEILGEGWTPLDELLPRKVVAQLIRDVKSAKDTLAQIGALDAFFADRLLNRALDSRLGKALREVFARRGNPRACLCQ